MRESLRFGRFFLPGPTEVRPEILRAQVEPMIGHRTPEMEALMQEIQPGLRQVFQTERPVYIAPASGTGMMEAAVRNCGRRRVLGLVNGAFSDRFARIAAANGLEVERLDVEWGQAHAPDQVERALAGGDFDAVTVVHSETSTGVLNPIEGLARVVHASGDVLLLVDTVSSAAGAPIHADRWGLDFALTSSQKALALPPGLAFGVAQPSALERSRGQAHRGVYFDFLAFEKNLERDQTPNTPAVSLLYALAAQMRRIQDEGIEGRWRRHADMAARTWDWVDEMAGVGHDMEVVAPEGFRSPTVTCIRVPAGWTGTTLCAAARRAGYTMAPGYGELRDEMFRIGHMGDHTLEELDSLLAVIAELLDAGAP